MGQLLRLLYATITVTLLLPHFGTAQKRNEEEYRKYTAEIQKEVWAWDHPAFNKANMAAADNKASAVILARHVDIKASTVKKLRSHFLNLEVLKDLVYIRTVRQMIKINDKAALDEYSELSYQQFEGLSYFKWRNATTIVGARILKADGTIKEVSIDESVLVKDDKRDKQRKLAISGLQVGDVLDYFIRSERTEGGAEVENELFVFGDDRPILHYSVHCELTDKFAVEYRPMNDAPEFTIKRDKDQDIILDLEMKDIPARPVNLWMSPFRQLPIVRMNIMMGAKDGVRAAGMVLRNPALADIKNDVRRQVNYMNYASSVSPYYSFIEDQLKLYNKEHNTKLPKDSIPYFVYYGFRYMSFYRVKPEDPIVVGPERNYWKLRDNWYVFFLSKVLSKFDVPHELVLATSKYGPAQQEVMSPNDYSYLLRIKGDKPVLMGADGLFTPAAHIPYEYEAQEAPVIDPKNMSIGGRHDSEAPVTIPVSTAADNVHIEKINISFGSDLQQALVNRQTTLKGNLREDGQKSLLLFEDYYEEERKALSVKRSFMEELSAAHRSNTLPEEYTSAFEKARKDRKEQFTAEITQQFDMAPKELKEFHIDKTGIRHDDPDFIYSTQFTMDGWLKKAGNNYILDAGKLIGGQLQLKPEQRSRQVDIYMPFARSFEYKVELQIPAGYQLEGVEQLNKQLDNECGSFIVSASTAQGKLLINVKKVYKHSYEPAAKWPALLEMLDAATDFSGRKLLLKKA